MFGSFMKKVAGGDEKKAGKASDFAEKLAGRDLDGDGDIAGVPIQKEEKTAPEPEAEAEHKSAGGFGDMLGGGGEGEEGGMDFGALMSQGQSMLSSSGALKPSAGGGGFAGLLNTFKGFSPEVQEKAEAKSRDLDDGSSIPLSTLDGNKKSLLIGINYAGTSNALKGCINDVNNVKSWITSKFGFSTSESNMRVLTDDQTDAHKLPTRANIIAGMKWLVEGAQSGDSLFIHYSGHGATQKDVRPDTDEADNQDETLVPMDYQTAGMVIDDEIFDIMVAPLPKGVRLTAVMDCCHSGSVFDLPYSYVFEKGNDSPVEVDNRKVAIAAALAAGKALMAKDYGGALKNLMGAGKAYMAMRNESENSNNADAGASSAEGGGSGLATDANVNKDYISIRTAVCDCIQFSGCKDNQTSADAFIGGESTGAMSYALIKAYEDHGPNQSFSDLLKNIRTILAGKYSQIPQMSCGHHMVNLDSTFSM